MQRERLDEPGGVDLLDRDAAEGSLVEVGHLEQRGRAIADAEQVVEQRQAVAVGGQDDRVDVVASQDLLQVLELAEHRHDRVRVVADEADELDAVGLARLECLEQSRGLLPCAEPQHAQRPIAVAGPVPADVPPGDGDEAEQRCAGEPERIRARAEELGRGDDQRHHERSGLRVPDDADGQRALVLAAIAQDGRADDPRQRRGGERGQRAGVGLAERDQPGEQHDAGEHRALAALPERERARRQGHRVGDCSDIRCAWGDCHQGIQCSWVDYVTP